MPQGSKAASGRGSDLGNRLGLCHCECMVGTFQYVVWRDRGWPLGPKRVMAGTTAMDPDDPYTLNYAIASAAGNDVNMGLYRMDVFALDGTLVVHDYRWSEWLDSTDDGSYDTEA